MKKTFVITHARTALAALAVSGSLALGLLPMTAAQAAVACPQANSAGAPAVNQQHVFCGEVEVRASGNRAKGFHSRPNGQSPATVTGAGAGTPQGPAGIYVLRNFTITENGASGTKSISTMFPDSCSQANVVAAIQNAYNNRTALNGNQFRGPSGASCQAGAPAASFNIVGYLDATGTVVTTAYPDY
ncbi:EndoU domain-containing protein [Pseudomonas sp. GD03858]|uniref:EndoU domain-containing protein n=1 Tax=unclassified Pseudomonas TaxID=196821 RepID=UPI00244CD8D5|nr:MULTISPECIES: EndoU domain-containing protein [unclassified Pseudomonas]MDH0645753.1 EndoU domain-containing protein [Pseudomonas sp. GD03867]MDH0661140.1 EndoU domain-containing protein [Pseudomonas sp. GD03858]